MTLLGPPYTLRNWWACFNIECNRCDVPKGQPRPLLSLIGSAVFACPRCGWRFQFLGFQWRGKTLEPAQLDIAIASAKPAVLSDTLPKMKADA